MSQSDELLLILCLQDRLVRIRVTVTQHDKEGVLWNSLENRWRI